VRYRSRREFLVGTAGVGAVGWAAASLPLVRSAPAAAEPAGPVFFGAAEWTTLQAAVAQIVPAETPGDWSAVDAGAHRYIDKLLAGFDDAGQPVQPEIFAGGPTRASFASFQTLSRVKLLGWGREVARLRAVYRDGLAELDLRAGGAGQFASAPATAQEAVLLTLDLEKHPFFDALYEHVMEGVYGHPVYGGNTSYLAWDAFCYQGDVHGVRFPDQLNPPGAVSDGAWNQHGGYAPEEMVQPGVCPGQGPVKP
jgi:gluconate 2-dehydrogenase gamma chain